MLTEAEKFPNVKLHFDHACMDVDLEQARCTFKHGTSGAVSTIKADLVFGSDGAPSAVRQAMMRGRFNFSQSYIEHDYKEIAFPASPAHLAPPLFHDDGPGQPGRRFHRHPVHAARG